ncbi:MAG: hypothetical protein LBD57_02725 [Endomicrobium sp.]|jgi:hypothetical protein|uniref:hypothetical protein n=1 Tax=Candidatus Endomicrobiellum cubanum TaxID=3242325 RepID=UPI002821C116|nr:hypothetical protein [Endomicrobium sp.]
METIKKVFNNISIKGYCIGLSGLYKYANVYLFIIGAVILSIGLIDLAMAQDVGGDATTSGGVGAGKIIKDQLCKILQLLEGAFGALVMVVAGLAAVVTAAMGAYKMAMSCVVIACGSYIVRAFLVLFFGESIVEKCDVGGIKPSGK